MLQNVSSKRAILASTEMPETNFCGEGGSISPRESPHLLKYTLETLLRSVLVEWYVFTIVDVTGALAHDSSHSAFGVC